MSLSRHRNLSSPVLSRMISGRFGTSSAPRRITFAALAAPRRRRTCANTIASLTNIPVLKAGLSKIHPAPCSSKPRVHCLPMAMLFYPDGA